MIKTCRFRLNLAKGLTLIFISLLPSFKVKANNLCDQALSLANSKPTIEQVLQLYEDGGLKPLLRVVTNDRELQANKSTQEPGAIDLYRELFEAEFTFTAPISFINRGWTPLELLEQGALIIITNETNSSIYYGRVIAIQYAIDAKTPLNLESAYSIKLESLDGKNSVTLTASESQIFGLTREWEENH